MEATTKDWHREDIKAEVRKTGISLTKLSLSRGLPEHACRTALLGKHVAGEKAISERIKVPLWELWPGRWRKPRKEGATPVRIDNRYGKKTRTKPTERHCLKAERG